MGEIGQAIRQIPFCDIGPNWTTIKRQAFPIAVIVVILLTYIERGSSTGKQINNEIAWFGQVIIQVHVDLAGNVAWMPNAKPLIILGEVPDIIDTEPWAVFVFLAIKQLPDKVEAILGRVAALGLHLIVVNIPVLGIEFPQPNADRGVFAVR